MVSMSTALVGLQLVLAAQDSKAAIVFTQANADDLASGFLSTSPGGAVVSGATLTGDPRCAGLFSNGNSVVTTNFPDAGVVISTGSPNLLNGQNSDEETTIFRTLGDSDLDAIVGGFTSDACVLEFDIECPVAATGVSMIAFDYVWGSDEYNEFVNTAYNDVFAWLFNGDNIALVPGTNVPVTVDNVNKNTNSIFFRNNDPSDFVGGLSGVPFPDMEADGFTTLLTATGQTLPGPNHLKLVISDRGDTAYDSWALVEHLSCVEVYDDELCE